MTTIEVWNKVYSPESGEDIFDYIEQAMREYARIKCLEAIRNTRHKIVDLMIEFDMEHDIYIELYYSIQNISNQDVMPEL